jgi:hypothetical protein
MKITSKHYEKFANILKEKGYENIDLNYDSQEAFLCIDFYIEGTVLTSTFNLQKDGDIYRMGSVDNLERLEDEDKKVIKLWEEFKANLPRRGRPKGHVPGNAKYGEKTVPVRVPVSLAGRIDEVLELFERLENDVIENWENKIAEAKQTSITGKIPRTYDKAKELLEEVRGLLQ